MAAYSERTISTCVIIFNLALRKNKTVHIFLESHLVLQQNTEGVLL